MDHVECIVVGAGVIGLAVARALALAGREVVILEAAAAIGTGISSRNSEVIHAGIYYPPGSLKAALCVQGRALLYEYCAQHHIPHRRCEKLIVATNAVQEQTLAAIQAKAQANGVDDLYPLSAVQAVALEPALRCTAALCSPSTGIIDTHSLMLAYLGDAEDHGAVLALNSPVVSSQITSNKYVIATGGVTPLQLSCNNLINAGGLGAQTIAATLQGFPPAQVPPLYLAKGNYFTLAGAAPFTRLIYPVPEPGGLGVHLTIDLAGQGRFGPDVEWIESINFDVDPQRSERFYPAIRSYWPSLPDGALQPGYAGIRPKLVPSGAADSDFVVQGPADHGFGGLVNLFGIESPGITASLAIARAVTAALA